MSDPKDPLDKGPIFELKMIGRLKAGQPRVAPPEDAVLSSRKNDREKGRKVAAGYAEEMLLMVVSVAREKGQDPNVVLRCAKFVCDRAWGQTKPVTEEEKRQAGVGDILELLAGVSTHAASIEQGTQEAPAIEHTTIDDDQSAEAFFEALRKDQLSDTVDGELVDD